MPSARNLLLRASSRVQRPVDRAPDIGCILPRLDSFRIVLAEPKPRDAPGRVHLEDRQFARDAIAVLALDAERMFTDRLEGGGRQQWVGRRRSNHGQLTPAYDDLNVAPDVAI